MTIKSIYGVSFYKCSLMTLFFENLLIFYILANRFEILLESDFTNMLFFHPNSHFILDVKELDLKFCMNFLYKYRACRQVEYVLTRRTFALGRPTFSSLYIRSFFRFQLIRRTIPTKNSVFCNQAIC